MRTERQDALRREHLGQVCRSLETFILEGGDLHLETTHGEATDDNKVTFTVPDWDGFVLALSPRTPDERGMPTGDRPGDAQIAR